MFNHSLSLPLYIGLRQLRENFIRATDLDCVLPESDVERQAQIMIEHLAKAGSLEVLEDG